MRRRNSPGLRKRADIARDALVFAAERPQARNKVRIRQKPHVENKVGIGGNSVAESEAHDGNQQRPSARILKTVDDELAQLVHVEFRRVDNDVREPPDRRHSPALFANALRQRSALRPADAAGASR